VEGRSAGGPARPRIVAVGGGTGLSVLLRGLKRYAGDTTAVVTVADDGGSSGRLRGELGVPPPGDVRNCLVALAEAEPLMRALFQYRFAHGEGLSGHSFGNLFIAALTEITGDFERAISESSRVLAVRGRVLPSTLDDVTLRARLSDGRTACGESRIAASRGHVERVWLHPGDAAPLPDVLEAIREADCIVLGPGSLYTSILPNLLVRGVARAIRSSSALKVLVVNIMSQRGETSGYSASDHVRAIFDHCGDGIVDVAIANASPVEGPMIDRYRAEGASPVPIDADELEALGVRVVEADLLGSGSLAWHDPFKLARVVVGLAGARDGQMHAWRGERALDAGKR